MTKLKDMLRDTAGNMTIIAAAGMGVILMAVGAAIDMSQLVSAKSRAADLADGMALAAAIAAHEGETRNERIELGKEAAQAVYEANFASLGDIAGVTPIVDIDDDTKDVTITVEANVDSFIMGMFGRGNSTTASKAIVSYELDGMPPISLAFAFDTSVSMSYNVTGSSISRLDVLQEATQQFFDSMEIAASDPVKLRSMLSTTFSSYNIDLVDSEDWSFGDDAIDDVIDYVDDMVPDKGTNSTPSLQHSYDQLVTNRPSTAHNWKGYLIFMTDGSNSDQIENDNSLAICNQLKADPAITVVTVTLDFKEKGQGFVRDCASPGNYYDSDDAEKTISDFAAIGHEIGNLIFATFRLKS